MKKKMILTILLVATLTTACAAPSAGQTVVTRTGAYGCRFWFDAAGYWNDCQPAGNLIGVVEDHPIGRISYFMGRVRVKMPNGTVLWFEPQDINSPFIPSG